MGSDGSPYGAVVHTSTTGGTVLLTLEERLAVVNLYEELGSYRAVAAVVSCDDKTVKPGSNEPEGESRSPGRFSGVPPTCAVTPTQSGRAPAPRDGDIDPLRGLHDTRLPDLTSIDRQRPPGNI